MTCRVEAGEIFNQIYNAENRIATIQKLDEGSGCPAPNTSANIEDILAEWLYAGVYPLEGYRDDVSLPAPALLPQGHRTCPARWFCAG